MAIACVALPVIQAHPDVQGVCFAVSIENHAVDKLDTSEGLVFKRSTGRYWVRQDGRTVLCALSSTLRKQIIYPTRDPASLGYFKAVGVGEIEAVDPVALGDRVRFRDALNDEGQIVEVLPRDSKLTRRAPGKKPLEQVVVANADQVIVTVAATFPQPSPTTIDRYLVSAEAAYLPAALVVTKWDDDPKPDWLADAIALYRRIGYPVVITSARSGEGLDELRALLAGKFSVLVGKSGVGKSSLLNALQPGLGLRVSEVNAYHGEGRHTTTHLEMFVLEGGGAIVDTPGMRGFNLWDVPEDEIIELFPELEEAWGRCKFADCTHRHEPGCAIRAALADGTLAASRYESYLKVRWDADGE